MWDKRRGWKRTLAALALVVCVAQAAAGRGALRPDALDAWVGEYVFEEDGGRTAGGSPIYVVHQITVTREGGALRARLESNGYQTYVAIECEVRAEPGRLRLYFARHADENALQRGDYKPGDHLLTLARSGRGRRARLLTYWGEFRPQFRRPRQGRVYFTRVDSETEARP